MLLLSTSFLSAKEFTSEELPSDKSPTKKKETLLPLKELQTFSEVFHHIKTSYHKNISDEELINAAISGMLNKLGKHTRYYSQQEFSKFNVASNGGRTGTLLPSVTSERLLSQVGYIAINQFTKKTPSEVITHLNQLIQDHDTNRLIIDLRNNLGGVLDASVDVANLFLDKGLIYSSKGKSIESNRKVIAESPAIFRDITLLIIMNRDSASSSEILAGALQDNKRAIILGEISYGKGTIQTVFALRNGAGIKMTTSEYFTPNGNQIQGKGIAPDIILDTKTLTPDLELSIFNDLPIYQAYLLLTTKIKKK
ncbi:MAG: hypothetical protein COB38_04475 [Gammaproteobacteria bacterium]|nr:MAG: hypothetical protein COB38_04475 [Gammaproteobacteria bacterium]